MSDRHPVYRRRRSLVVGIVGFLADQEAPIPWDELLAVFRTEDLSWRTIENTIRDLEAFGAIHRVGKVVKGKDTRALVATPLGRAWLEAELVPLPGEHQADDVDDEIPEDPFELADAIADTIDELAGLDLENPLDPHHDA